jgi:hypothetical protein
VARLAYGWAASVETDRRPGGPRQSGGDFEAFSDGASVGADGSGVGDDETLVAPTIFEVQRRAAMRTRETDWLCTGAGVSSAKVDAAVGTDAEAGPPAANTPNRTMTSAATQRMPTAGGRRTGSAVEFMAIRQDTGGSNAMRS